MSQNKFRQDQYSDYKSYTNSQRLSDFDSMYQRNIEQNLNNNNYHLDKPQYQRNNEIQYRNQNSVSVDQLSRKSSSITNLQYHQSNNTIQSKFIILFEFFCFQLLIQESQENNQKSPIKRSELYNPQIFYQVPTVSPLIEPFKQQRDKLSQETFKNKYDIKRFKIDSLEPVEKSSPKKLYIQSSYIGKNMDVKDINDANCKLYKRDINPLNPEYDIYKKYGHLQEHTRNLNFQREFNSMVVTDIKGTQSGDIYVKNPKYKYNGVKLVNNVQDIQGAQAGTLKKILQTKRTTNPLQPNYSDLGQPKLILGYRADTKPVPIQRYQANNQNYKPTSIY